MVTFSGDSELDAVKAIALIVDKARVLFDLQDVGDNSQRAISQEIHPIFAIPTTSGSEFKAI